MIDHQTYSNIQVSVYQQAKGNNYYCGDSYFMFETDEYFICAVADGLGSGEDANLASTTAVSIIERYHDDEVDALMERCNRELGNKRGTVLSILKIQYDKQRLSYVNIGNIRFVLYSPSGVLARPVPKSGYLCGKRMNFRVQYFTYYSNSSFILYTDGFHLNSQNQHILISEMNSPKEAASHLIEMNDEFDDDATFLIGKLR